VVSEAGVSRWWRTLAILASGIALGVAITATPVAAHVGGSVGHLWRAHIRPRTDHRYYTKTQANHRFYNDSELWAVVDGIGATLVRGRGVTAVGSPASGEYTVDFKRDVSKCAFIATPGSPGTYGGAGAKFLMVARRMSDPNGVFVKAFDSGGGGALTSFHLAVFC
jgi:hypothetical protein